MDIVKTKRLENKVNEVKVFGRSLTFLGNKAGIVSVPNGKNYNVVITSNLEKIPAEDYVFPSMVSHQTAYELYEDLR